MINDTYNPANGVNDEQWKQFEHDGYLIVHGIFTQEEVNVMRNSIELECLLVGESVTEQSALQNISGLNSSFGWNKHCWARAANILPSIHPKVYRYTLLLQHLLMFKGYLLDYLQDLILIGNILKWLVHSCMSANKSLNYHNQTPFSMWMLSHSFFWI